MWFTDLIESLINAKNPFERFFLSLILVSIVLILGYLIFLIGFNLLNGNLLTILRKSKGL